MSFWVWFAIILSMVNFLCGRRDYHDIIDIFNKLEKNDMSIKHLQDDATDTQKCCSDIASAIQDLNERLMEFEGDSYDE